MALKTYVVHLGLHTGLVRDRFILDAADRDRLPITLTNATVQGASTESYEAARNLAEEHRVSYFKELNSKRR
jgi:hypothetical protein